MDSLTELSEIRRLSDGDLLDALRQASDSLARLQRQLTLMAGEVEYRVQRQRPPEDSLRRLSGARNAVQVVQAATGASARVVKTQFAMAQSVADRESLTGEVLPPKHRHVAAALASGELPFESAAHISRLLTKNAFVDPEHLDAAERSLVQAGSGLDFGSGDTSGYRYHADAIRVMAGAWQEALDADGAEPNDEKVLSRRGLRLGREINGVVDLSGKLLPETAALLARIFDACSAPRADRNAFGRGLQNDSEHADQSAYDGGAPGVTQSQVEVDIDVRTADQKRHDALMTALQAAITTKDLPSPGGAPITVVMQAKEETLVSGDGVAQIQDHEGTLGFISQEALHHGVCAGALQFIRQDKLGRIIELGSPQRVFTANQRRAIAVRDQGCVIPGCMTPPGWCEIHHATPHVEGGPTHTDNGVMLCFYHHRTLDSSGWDVTMNSGVPTVTPPTWLQRYMGPVSGRGLGAEPGRRGGAPPRKSPESPPGSPPGSEETSDLMWGRSPSVASAEYLRRVS